MHKGCYTFKKNKAVRLILQFDDLVNIKCIKLELWELIYNKHVYDF